jgi:hypothetical protein
MQNVRLSGPALDKMLVASILLKEANASMSRAKKDQENAKSTIQKILLDERKLDLSKLKIGDMVLVENCVMFEMGSMNKFAESDFALSHIDLYEQFKKIHPVHKYKPVCK